MNKVSLINVNTINLENAFRNHIVTIDYLKLDMLNEVIEVVKDDRRSGLICECRIIKDDSIGNVFTIF